MPMASLFEECKDLGCLHTGCSGSAPPWEMDIGRLFPVLLYVSKAYPRSSTVYLTRSERTFAIEEAKTRIGL
jgi:hypothetical protein